MDSHTAARLDWAATQGLSNGHFEAALEALAHQLEAEFFRRRAELQEIEKARLAAEAASRNRKPKQLWCQIQIRARTKDGFRLEWQTYNKDKVTKAKKYKHIARNKATGLHDLRSLAQKAHPFEMPLVEEIEFRARRLREDWRTLLAVRRTVRSATGDDVEQASPPSKAAADRTSDLAFA